MTNDNVTVVVLETKMASLIESTDLGLTFSDGSSLTVKVGSGIAS